MQTIYLDISNKGVVPTIYAKQGDVGRKFEVVFTDSGIPYSIPTNAKISIWYEGDSGVGNYTDIGENSAIAIGENKAVVELITQMLSEDGEGIVCLVMNAGNNQIGSWNIQYLCERVPGFYSEGAKEYYTAFSKTVESLKQVTENLTPEAIGAHPDTWLPTIEEIGAAPAGYVDERGQYTDYTSALAQIKSVYASMGDRTKRCLFIDILNRDSTNFPTGSYFVEIYREWETYGTIVFTSSAYIKIIIRIAGSWGDFCYENPPMAVGVEYRTTERWNGKPVWTSLTKISGLPNAAYGQYNLAATNCDNVIRKHTSYERADGATFLNILEAGDIYVGSYGNPYIVFNRTTSDLSTMTAYVTLFYTKTTD